MENKTKTDLWLWTALLLVIVFTVILRCPLLEIPLERDEGEYAYAGRLLSEGTLPYAEAYNMKMPGIYGAYAVILSVFDSSPAGIHLALLFINAVTTILFFLLFKKVFDSLAALLGACSFALLSVLSPVHGFMANAEHFVLLFVAGGALVLLHAVSRKSPVLTLLSGLLFGFGFLMKQHAVLFIGFAVLYLIFARPRKKSGSSLSIVKSLIYFLIGVAVPLTATLLILYLGGVFERFWFWTYTYGTTYVQQVPLSQGLDLFLAQFGRIFNESPAFLILASIGFFIPQKHLAHKTTKERSGLLFLYLFVICSFLATSPGLLFREHYFIYILPCTGLLAGAAASTLGSAVSAGKPIVRYGIAALLIIGSVSWQIWSERDIFFKMTPTQVSKKLYQINPFPESLEIARYIQEHSEENDKIGVLGSEPQIFFYANRRSATGYIYTYALMEDHPYSEQMQDEMIAQIEAARPRFLVNVNIPLSWLMRKNSESKIFDWASEYTDAHYERVGLIEIRSLAVTLSLWEDDAEGYEPASPFWIEVLERKD